MPTDFSAYVELKIDGVWTMPTKYPIEILGEYFSPIIETLYTGGICKDKGLPGDISNVLKKYYEVWEEIDPVLHRESWLTLKELKDADWKGGVLFLYKDDEDSCKKVFDELEALISNLESYNMSEKDIRIVYWVYE